jgi:hypothetical protein
MGLTTEWSRKKWHASSVTRKFREKSTNANAQLLSLRAFCILKNKDLTQSYQSLIPHYVYIFSVFFRLNVGSPNDVSPNDGSPK